MAFKDTLLSCILFQMNDIGKEHTHTHVIMFVCFRVFLHHLSIRSSAIVIPTLTIQSVFIETNTETKFSLSLSAATVLVVVVVVLS